MIKLNHSINSSIPNQKELTIIIFKSLDLIEILEVQSYLRFACAKEDMLQNTQEVLRICDGAPFTPQSWNLISYFTWSFPHKKNSTYLWSILMFSSNGTHLHSVIVFFKMFLRVICHHPLFELAKMYIRLNENNCPVPMVRFKQSFRFLLNNNTRPDFSILTKSYVKNVLRKIVVCTRTHTGSYIKYYKETNKWRGLLPHFRSTD